ncbi:MAG: hypothetical protein FJZ95_10560, partial [Chloroflexi bacterium]|nr:hypothetical protein [Chloroflexota bacterium]
AGSRWQVCAKSPASTPQSFSYANAGGSWGAWLKFAGFDGVIVTGKSERPVYLYLHNGEVELRDAKELWGRTTTETRDILKRTLGETVRVAVIGPAGENKVRFATLLADDDASASGGFGSVMGSKNLKAIAVAGTQRPQSANPEELKKLANRALSLRKGTWDSLQTGLPGQMKQHACWGCITGCGRSIYKATTGEQGKFFCQSGIFYVDPAVRYHRGWNEAVFHASRLCNEFGLNTNVIEPMIAWLSRCHEAGILSDEETGVPLSKIGSYEFIETLIRKISLREGFGDVLAQGTTMAAELIGKGSEELIGELVGTRADEDRVYDPRLYHITALLYATEPRKPIRQLHEVSWPLVHWARWAQGKRDAFLSTDTLRGIARRFWGSEEVVDFSSYAGVALAAKKIQDRVYAEECLILCDYMWPITWVRHSEDHLGNTTLESQILSAATGREMDEAELNMVGERVFNLQRAVFLREGHRGRVDDRLFDFFHGVPLESEPHLNRSLLVPGRDGQPICRKGAVVQKSDFERLKDEYYGLRGWGTATGVPTREKIEALGLCDVESRLTGIPGGA